MSSQAGALLKFGVKQKWWGGRTLDDKSPDMSVEELPLLPLVRVYSRNTCTLYSESWRAADVSSRNLLY